MKPPTEAIKIQACHLKKISLKLFNELFVYLEILYAVNIYTV